MDEDQIKDNEVDEEVLEDQPQEEAQEELQEEEQQEEELTEDEQEELPEDSQEEEAPEQPSRREQLRIQSLLRKYGDPTDRQAPQQKGIDYRDMINADDEVYEQLENRTSEYASQVYQEGVQRAEYLNWHTGLKIDTPNVHRDFPEVAKNDRLRDSLNEEYLSFVGFDPKTQTVKRPEVSYYDYVDARVEQAKELAETMVERTRKNVTRQAARTGLRPDGSSAKRLDLSKDPSQMTDEELDAALAKQGLLPKKR